MLCLDVLSAETLRGYGNSCDGVWERDVYMAWDFCDLFASVEITFPGAPSGFSVWLLYA
jgi:hypothetical protein